jgi:TRAP transporter TAXI family solute receptor
MTIRIGTSERDGTFYSQGRALKMLFERHPALVPVEVLESHSASTENANRLHGGEIEFGFMASNWIGRAKNGEAPFERPIELAMAAPMNAGPLFFIVRAESPIRSFSDLRGRRIAVGLRTSGMVQHAHGLFGALGMSFSDFTPVYLDFAAGADALAAGDIDAQFQCPIPNPVMTPLAQTRCATRAAVSARRARSGDQGRAVLWPDRAARRRDPRPRRRPTADRGAQRACHASPRG